MRPHKEERFLFPAFPSLYIGAAASLDAGASALGALGAKFVTPRTTRRFITYVALGAAALLGAARVAALAVYDMTKALSHSIVVEDLRLVEKTGGKSDYSE